MLNPEPVLWGILLALISASAEAQGMRPPARYDGPSIEGFDTSILFQRWVRYVEHQKGDVLEAALSEPDNEAGSRRRWQPLMEARAAGDYGLAMISDISILCPEALGVSETQGCRPRMRELTLPQSAAGWVEGDALGDWTRAAFDPVVVVQALKASGVTAGGNLQFVDVNPIFARMASPAETLRAGLKIRSVDAIACPALGQALEALEGRTLEWRVDLRSVGDDSVPPPPGPHATRWRYTLRVLAEDVVTVDAGSALASMVEPSFVAGVACMGKAG